MEFYRAQVEEIARKICQEMHLAVYDIEEKMSGKGRIITVYLLKLELHWMNAAFSNALGKELEIFDLIPERYFWRFLLQGWKGFKAKKSLCECY